VSGDAGRLQQVLWNLMSNAVKFTPSGGRVRIALRERGSHVEIEVTDTGKGIEPRFLPHVFEPFRQADGGTTRSTGGLGLGLAIVKHIVELHGGAVEAMSEGMGRGSSFTVRLPVPAVRPASRVTGRNTAITGGATDVGPPQLTGLHVLVVEDDVDAREMLRTVLEASGAEVTTEGTVGDALRAIERDVPDVLLSDIGMAEESGLDLIRRVRALPPERGGTIPAAALTAYARSEDRRSVLSAGFQLHVPKPIEPGELVTVVATLAKFAEA
jgi:CheY-like chemotaxis protein